MAVVAIVCTSLPEIREPHSIFFWVFRFSNLSCRGSEIQRHRRRRVLQRNADRRAGRSQTGSGDVDRDDEPVAATTAGRDDPDVDADGDPPQLAYCGCSAFDAPDDVMYLPFWIMAKLGVDEGDEVEFRSARLPKGTFVQLQPVAAAWIDIPMEEREAL